MKILNFRNDKLYTFYTTRNLSIINFVFKFKFSNQSDQILTLRQRVYKYQFQINIVVLLPVQGCLPMCLALYFSFYFILGCIKWPANWPCGTSNLCIPNSLSCFSVDHIAHAKKVHHFITPSQSPCELLSPPSSSFFPFLFFFFWVSP